MATFPKVQRLGLSDRNLVAVQSNLADSTDRLNDLPYVSGVHLLELDLDAGENSISHLLGRKPQGYFVSRLEGAFGTSNVSYEPQPAKIRQIHVHDSNQTTGGIANTDTITLPKAPLDGSTLVVALGCGAPAGSVGMELPTQTGATYTAVHALDNSVGINNRLYTWYAENVASAGTSIVITTAGVATLRGTTVVIELIGVETASFDIAASSTYSTGTQYNELPSLTPSQTDTFYLAFMCENAGAPLTLKGYVPVAHPTDWYGMEGISQIACLNARQAGSATGLTLGVIGGYCNRTTGFRGYISHVSTTNVVIALNSCMTFKAEVPAGAVSTSVTVPHGLRFVSSDTNFLVLNSIAAVTADIWVF